MKLLLVDDDERVRELLRTTFELADVEVCEAADTRSAAEEILLDRPDAIVLDVAMPGESGLSLCRRLKDDPDTAEIPVVLLTGSPLGAEAAAAGADAFLTKPFSPLELLGLIERLPGPGRTRGTRAAERVDDQLLLYAQDMRRLLERERAQRKALERAYVETVETLTTALESRDTDTGEHAQRVRLYAVVLTGEVSPGLLDSAIEYGFLLHDVGKLGIPQPILFKSGPLTDAEWDVMRTHPELGLAILGVTGRFTRELLAVLYHHERMDGSGYPHGLASAEIPIEARIVAVADTFDVLTSDRPYRHAFSHGEALERVQLEAGAHLDPAVVDALMRTLAA
jgi:putative two-component system response regulator